jgi:hypothetical protein
MNLTSNSTIMNKTIEKLKLKIVPLLSGVIGFGDSKIRDLRDYETLEPEKFKKTLRFAVSLYEDNKEALDFIKNEATAYWKIIDYMGQDKFNTGILLQAFKKGNLKQGQTWIISFKEGDMNWQRINAAMSSELKPL